MYLATLRDRWIRAAKSVGIERVRLYEGTKHTMATDAVRRGVPERALQTFLGHSDARSTRRYARMSEETLVSVLRAAPSPPNSVDLSPARIALFQPSDSQRESGVPNGTRTRSPENAKARNGRISATYAIS